MPFPAETQTAFPEPVLDGTVWAQAFGGRSEYSDDPATADVEATIGGIISGVDLNVDNWLIGAAVGYTSSGLDIDALRSSANVDSLLVALYAGTHFGPWNLRGGASYAFNQIDVTRSIAYPGYAERAKADYGAGTAQMFTEIGYGFAVRQVAVEPFAGLAYFHHRSDDFNEAGAAAGLAGSSSAADVGYSSLGLRLATTMELARGMTLEPHASLAWQHAFGDVTPQAQMAFLSAPTANFTVAGAPLAENTALAEIGADLRLSERARLGVSYFGQIADSATVNAVQANLRWRF